MAKSQATSNRKVSGKKYAGHRKKKHYELGRNPALTLIGKFRLKIKRGLGGNAKKQLLSTETVLINDGKKVIKVPILSVDKNPANVNYTRRNIITKGAIVKTEKGDVKITSRPGQAGSLFGVLLK